MRININTPNLIMNMNRHFLKGQIAAEYLVIFALILTIALVAIGLSIFFIQQSSEINESEVRTYWATQVRPIRVVDMQGYTSGPKIALMLENVDDKHITITNMVLEPPDGGATITFKDAAGAGLGNTAIGISYQLAPGEKKAIFLETNAVCTDSGTGTANSEKYYNFLTIKYDTPYFSGLKFKGVKQIAGKCN
jgi:hypothetical protein